MVIFKTVSKKVFFFQNNKLQCYKQESIYSNSKNVSLGCKDED